MTFSIIGIDRQNKEIGIACFSKAFAVGSIVPAINLDSGAIATQSYPNVSYKLKALDLMIDSPLQKVVNTLIDKDNDRELRQFILMNSNGESIGYTGKKNVGWAGHIKGKNCICAGNMLVGEIVIKKMINAFEKSKKNLCQKLLDSLKAGEGAGGDKRNKKWASASLIIEKRDRGIFGIGNRFIDIRVDYSNDTIKDLAELLRLNTKQHKYQKNKGQPHLEGCGK